MLTKLMEVGSNLDDLKKKAFTEERNLIKNLKNSIHFNNNSIKSIRDIKKPIYFVAAAETWCPYARSFFATVDKMMEINSNINLSIITYGRGMVFMAKELGIAEEDFVIPTVAVLNDKKELISTYVGYPEEFKENFSEIKEEFFSGEKANEIVKELLKNIVW